MGCGCAHGNLLIDGNLFVVMMKPSLWRASRLTLQFNTLNFRRYFSSYYSIEPIENFLKIKFCKISEDKFSKISEVKFLKV